MIQLVFHTHFWDMPWYSKLGHLLLSYNKSAWKSIQITDDHKIKYYYGFDDPSNTEVTGWVVSQIDDYDWEMDWKPRLQHIPTNPKKFFFTSNTKYEDLVIAIDNTIVYDEQHDDVSWTSDDDDTRWIITKMIKLFDFYKDGTMSLAGNFIPYYARDSYDIFGNYILYHDRYRPGFISYYFS